VQNSNGDHSELPTGGPMVYRTRGPQPCGAAIVLIHGLGGSGDTTWGKTPDFLLSDDIDADVAVCDYPSGHRRLTRRRTASVEELAPVFAHIIRDSQHYQHFVLVGHSMGGLLCMAIIQHLLRTPGEGSRSIRRVVGLIMMATPQAGSMRARSRLAKMSPDGRVLSAHSKFVEELHQTFINGVATRPDPGLTSKALIPTYAVVAQTDQWVDTFSASVGLEDDQQKRVLSSHTDVVKPKSPQDDTHQWVVGRIKECQLRARARAAVENQRYRQPESLSVSAGGGLASGDLQIAAQRPNTRFLVIDLGAASEGGTP
jgi:pimeloyl-ACP methyl ester carboxylesterase